MWIKSYSKLNANTTYTSAKTLSSQHQFNCFHYSGHRVWTYSVLRTVLYGKIVIIHISFIVLHRTDGYQNVNLAELGKSWQMLEREENVTQNCYLQPGKFRAFGKQYCFKLGWHWRLTAVQLFCYVMIGAPVAFIEHGFHVTHSSKLVSQFRYLIWQPITFTKRCFSLSSKITQERNYTIRMAPILPRLPLVEQKYQILEYEVVNSIKSTRSSRGTWATQEIWSYT